MQRRFDDRVVIVTGGASGIGEACVHRLAAEGGRVLLVDINDQGARQVAEKAGPEVQVCVADICEERGVGAGIRANSITPGAILSPAIAQAVDHVGMDRVTKGLGTRPGTPDELSRVVAFLAGVNIPVDGGWFAQRDAGGINFGMPAQAD
jgi:NAD(P)-dependent dehydrogenase (short-subunit alcohol dehydrogenase family)